MSIEISNTKLFDEKEQPAEILPETESNYQTHLSPAHVNYINTNLLHDNHTPLPSPSLIQRNTKDPIDELSKLKKFGTNNNETVQRLSPIPRQKNET